MAKIALSVILDRASGKAGNAVFYQGRQGPCMRARIDTPNPRTPAQQAARAHMTQAAQAWKALSPQDAQAWNQYAKTQPHNPTGNTEFIRLTTKYLQIQSYLEDSKLQTQTFANDPSTCPDVCAGEGEVAEGRRGLAQSVRQLAVNLSGADACAAQSKDPGPHPKNPAQDPSPCPKACPDESEAPKDPCELPQTVRNNPSQTSNEPRPQHLNPTADHEIQIPNPKLQTFPKTPPTTPFNPEPIQISATRTEQGILFTLEQGTLDENTLVELLLQPLPSPNRKPEPHRYKTQTFTDFQKGPTLIATDQKTQSPAYRLINPTTGQATSMQPIYLVQ